MKRLALVPLVTLVTLGAGCGSPRPAVTTPAPEPKHVEPEPQPMPPKPPEPTTMPAMQTAKPQELVFPEEDFRKQQPAPAAEKPFKFPAVKKFALANGITTYLVEQHALPLVTLQLEIDGGGLADPRGKDGLASVCAAMLTEGTDALDKLQYAEALANIASTISSGTTDDTISISMSSLKKHFDATFALFAQTLRTPGMRAADFDRMIKRRLEGLKQARAQPAAIPGRVNGAILYGPDHPRGGVVTEASYQAIDLEACKQFVARTIKPAGARLFVVGDMTQAEVEKAFAGEPAFHGWTGAPPKLPAEPAPKPMAGRIFFVDVPGAVQSQVWMLGTGPQRTAATYFENSVLAAVFGGGFASRINMNLREDKGYSYGARGGFSYTRHLGEWNASTQVRADSTYQTLLELHREYTDLATGKTPATPEEVEREKIGVQLALPGRFATAQSALGQYRGLVYYGLPLDYYDHYAARVAKVTPELVKRAAKAELKPNVVYLVVGDGSTKVVVHDPHAAKDAPIDQRNPPYLKDGKQLTLREALADVAARGDVGAGGLVELDADAHIVKP